MTRPSAENSERVLAFVRSSVELITPHLVKAGMSAEDAAEVARNCVNDITAAHARTWMYIPADLNVELTKRDQQIYQAFNGTNIAELARKYTLTTTRIRQIIARARLLQNAARQHRLPGLEETQEG